MDNITIPPEAIEAAAKDLRCSMQGIVSAVEWDALSEQAKDFWRFRARAACLAMLKAWPGMDTGPNIYGRQNAIIRLPLPQEPTND